jgi:hypothetical protein
MKIYTSHWFAEFPDDAYRVGISRGTPRGTSAGYSRLPELAPGPWFRSVDSQTYLHRYNAQLYALQPGAIVEKLAKVSGGKNPVMLCYERPADIAAGKYWCHRHIVAQWLNDTLDLEVEELKHPDLDWWATLRKEGVSPPRYLPSGEAFVEPLDVSPYLGSSAIVNGHKWTVIGRSENHPDQAVVEREMDGRQDEISEHLLKTRFSADQQPLI